MGGRAAMSLQGSRTEGSHVQYVGVTESDGRDGGVGVAAGGPGRGRKRGVGEISGVSRQLLRDGRAGAGVMLLDTPCGVNTADRVSL